MPAVVSDTSPMRGLQCLDLLGLLPALFGEIIVPPEVARELSKASELFRALDVRSLGYCRVVPPRDRSRVEALGILLDKGETDALSVALEIGATRVLMDDYAGRDAAKQLGLVPMGLGGILVGAKQLGLLRQVMPLLETVRNQIRFTVAPEVMEQIRRAAGE